MKQSVASVATQTNRRQFLALTLGLTGAGALFLTGCGSGKGTSVIPGIAPGSVSGGGGSAGAGLVSRRFTVQFPSGFALSPADLIAETGKASVALDASGVFTDQTPNTDIPSLVLLRDKSGRGVFMAFLPAPASGDTPLTPRSAAVALLYYALGGFMLPEANRRPLVNLLETDATTVMLGATIAQRLVASPYVLEGSDAEINAAVKTAYDTLTGTGRAIRSQSFAAALKPSRAVVDPILQVQPSGLLSNIEIVQGTGTNVTAVNHSRRYCRVYTYQVGTPDALPKAILQGAPVKLDSTNALGIFSTINNLVSGQTAYVPVSSDPIALPLASGSTKTLYELIVVGASANDSPRGFYSDPKYADEQAKWVQDQQDLSTLTWWQNLILPCFFEALGIAGLGVATNAVEASLAALKAIGEQSVKQILFNAGKGSFIAAAGDFWLIASESTVVGEKVRQGLLPLYEAAIGQIAAETAAARLALFARLVVRAAISAVVLLGAGDIAAVLSDTLIAQPAEQWFATVLQPTLILDPTSKSISAGQRVTFSVKPPVGTVGTISYAWTQTGSGATLSSSDGVVGNSITTASTSVDLVTTASDSGTITVTVVATLTDPSGKQSELGRAQAAITLSAGVTVGATAFGFIKEYGGRNPAIYIFYAVGAPPANWVKCELSGSGFGTLYKSDYDHGAPEIDQTRNTDVSTIYPYDGYPGASTSGGGGYNLGGGAICFASRDVFGVNVLAADAEKRLAEFLKLVNDKGAATATFT